MDTGDVPVPAGHRQGRFALLAVAGILTVTATVTIGFAVAGRGGDPPRPDASAAAPAADASPVPATKPGELTSGPLMASSPPARVSIPSLKATAAVVALGLRADGAMQVPDNATEVGWFTKAPVPGALGPAVLAGHVNWKGRRGTFFDLGKLAVGAGIMVDRRDGSTAMFTVTKVEQYPKDRFPTDEVYGPTDHAALRLITCGGEFDEATQHYRDNVIVYARLAHAHPA
ncbi:class F sortase [Micromonospora sp. STR1_7]|uniref:Class F sortase n=1 Tax=Micromonospora parastrephiae TaxID=2806101 RepID=A0ABS1XPE5_9ACTN|nr:class F sortase [Micromonospora parastrephiae]MBM0231117.1 class F sortase [Micromonospora parastrephiae]